MLRFRVPRSIPESQARQDGATADELQRYLGHALSEMARRSGVVRAPGAEPTTRKTIAL
jgi:hypothetical protein